MLKRLNWKLHYTGQVQSNIELLVADTATVNFITWNKTSVSNNKMKWSFIIMLMINQKIQMWMLKLYIHAENLHVYLVY